MKLLVFVLSDVEKLQPLLKKFKDDDIPGATIFDSTGMGRELVDHDEFSIFGSMRNLISHNNQHTKTLLLVVDDADVEKITHDIETVVGSLDQPDSGILFTLPIDFVKGLKRLK
jgi:nitrogen regulatory protein PII